MAHKFKIVTEVVVERTEGLFAARDEMAEVLIEWIENANEETLSGLGSDGTSEYEVLEWNVEEVES